MEEEVAMTIHIEDGKFAGTSWSAEEFNEILRLHGEPIGSVPKDQLTPDDPSLVL